MVTHLFCRGAAPMNESKRVCIISSEVVGPHKNGGVGTHCFYLSGFLSRELGCQVTLLYTGQIAARDERYWTQWFKNELGIEFVWLVPPSKAPEEVPEGLWGYHASIARQVFEWLRQQRFDECHFQDMHANGFRCFQAKRLGLAFQDTLLSCTVHSSMEWICEAMQALPQAGLEELQTKYMERYCVQQCDVLISPSQHMLSWLVAHEIRLPRNRHLLPYLFDPKLKKVGAERPAGHLIFFGRLEVRKGLLLFLRTLLELDRKAFFAERKIKVTFLGRSGYTPDGGGSESIRRFRSHCSANITVEEVNGLGQQEALEFLTRHNDALVVCPSLMDNSPYAVIECLQLGLNLIAAESGGIPELFKGQERLFKPTPEALAEKIVAGLNNALPPASKQYDLPATMALWREFCQERLPVIEKQMGKAAEATRDGSGGEARPGMAATSNSRAGRPTVRLFLGLAGFVGEPLRSLQAVASQTLTPVAVTVLAETGHVSDQLKEYCRKQKWAFADRCALAEKAAEESNCDYVAYVRLGCVASPDLLGRMTKALEHSKLDAVTCWAKVAREGGEFLYEPLGPCLEAGLHHNLLGAGCVVLRMRGGQTPLLQMLQNAGPGGLWCLFAKLTAAGCDWDVLPERLTELDSGGEPLCGPDLDYASHRELVRSCINGLPAWVDRFLEEALARYRTMEGRTKDTTRKTVSQKVKREIRRLFRQCESLFR
jgi:glycosyltransferase involved in cell wall biosynthesis